MYHKLEIVKMDSKQADIRTESFAEDGTFDSTSQTDNGTSQSDNPFGLSQEELRVLRFWQNGESMTDAYKIVMLSEYDQKAIKKSALTQRVKRFFDTYRMREAMANSPGERGKQAKADFEKWRKRHDGETIKRFTDGKTFSQTNVIATRAGKAACKEDIEKELKEKAHAELEVHKAKIEKEYEEKYEEKYQDRIARDKKEWWDSLNINVNPSALTIYGTGQFLASVAVKEIIARQLAIRQQGVDVLARDGRGSALTPVIVSAIKTAAALVLPFAPAPSAEDRKQFSKAAVLLGLLPDEITENPDDYTAPLPATIDVGGDA
jgi:hypothetical protein